MSVKIYCATAMTGRTGLELWEEVAKIRPIYEKYGIEFITPVEGEGIAANKLAVADRSDEEMTRIWKKKDKNQIRDTHVFVYIAPEKTSQGITKEYCLARGVLWKPTVGVYTKVRAGFISRAEDDAVVTSHEEAALLIKVRWGSLFKRLNWRLHMLNRCLLGFIWDQIKEFK